MKIVLWIASAALVFSQKSEVAWRTTNAEGIEMVNAGRYADAEIRFRQALVEAEQFGEDDYRLWSTLSNLALARQEQGDYADAERLSRRVLSLRERNLASDDKDIAGSLNNLAAVLHAAGRDREADPLLRRALAIAQGLGDDDLTAPILNTLALTLMEMGEGARAEPVLRRALAMFEKSKGADSLEAAKVSCSLATLESSSMSSRKRKPGCGRRSRCMKRISARTINWWRQP